MRLRPPLRRCSTHRRSLAAPIKSCRRPSGNTRVSQIRGAVPRPQHVDHDELDERDHGHGLGASGSFVRRELLAHNSASIDVHPREARPRACTARMHRIGCRVKHARSGKKSQRNVFRRGVHRLLVGAVTIRNQHFESPRGDPRCEPRAATVALPRAPLCRLGGAGTEDPLTMARETGARPLAEPPFRSAVVSDRCRRSSTAPRR